MAAVMAAVYADLYGAVGVHSGVAYRCAHNMLSALVAMRGGGSPPPASEVPLIVFHGDNDRTVACSNADKLIACRLAAQRPSARRPVLRVTTTNGEAGSHRYRRRVYHHADGVAAAEQWTVHGGAHTWFGGNPLGSYTTAQGPDASAEIVRFFLEHTTSDHRR
jgi:poly(3-hydroxybutyrate) depolymerase